MANPNAIVSESIRLEVPKADRAAEMLQAREAISVELDDGRRARLDPGDRRSPGFAQVLVGLAELRRPVYLELEPETAAVTRLLIPHVGRIVELRDGDKGIEAELDSSHGRFLLANDDPDRAEAAALLRQARAERAPVLLTADDAQRIVDVRRFRGPPESLVEAPGGKPAAAEPGLADSILRFWRWPIWPWRWWPRGCVSPRRAQEVFDAMSGQTCNPAGIAPPCIPFLYPDDGCWGRAHEMRRLMNNMGVYPRKIWIYGSLHTPTRNNPNCFVNWGWHVAPTICVRRRWSWWPWRWFGLTQRMVIDPSLFTTPVTPTQWKAVQGDPGATLEDTHGSVFHWAGYRTDPSYALTNNVLATYRLALQNRVNQVGPPPYANCP